MREIKFKALDRNDSKIKKVLRIDFENELVLFEGEYAWVDFDNVELMQYTGLKDKNGKEIYEGDIVEENDSIGIIAFYGCEFRIAWKVNKDFFNNSLYCHYKFVEVIGNKYDNPELLGGQAYVK